MLWLALLVRLVVLVLPSILVRFQKSLNDFCVFNLFWVNLAAGSFLGFPSWLRSAAKDAQSFGLS